MQMTLLNEILLIGLGLVVGLVIGFFLAKFFMQRYLKKNPPINEEMVKIMMSSMGRTPSQKQVNQVMKQIQKVK